MECAPPPVVSDHEGSPRPQRQSVYHPLPSDWSTTSRTMRSEVRKIASHPDSFVFRSSSVPDSIMHVTDALAKDPRFKESKDRADVAGACGLSFLRSAEIVDATVPEILKTLQDIDKETLDVVSTLLVRMHNDIMDTSTSGTKVAAGAFNAEVAAQRKLVLASKVGSSIKDTLAFCPPSSGLLFQAQGSRIKDALEAARADRSAGRSSFGGKSSFRKSYSKKPSSSKSAAFLPAASPSIPKEKRAGNF